MELLTKASYSPEVSERERRNLEVAYKAACESMVLLKNDGVLPLKTKKVALYGPGASKTIKGGTASGEVNERHSVTILEGMEDRGFEIATKQWIADYEQAYEDGVLENKKAQRKALKTMKVSSVMEMMFSAYQAPNGRAITQKDIEDSDTDTAIYVLDAGEYIVRLGNSSRSNVPVAVVILDANVVVSTHCNICPVTESMEELKAQPYVAEDPFLTGEVAAALTKGVQQEEGFYVTVKHFACNNMEENRNRVSSNVSERALREIYLRGFEKVMQKVL